MGRQVKQFLSIAMVLCMLIAVVPLEVKAEENCDSDRVLESYNNDHVKTLESSRITSGWLWPAATCNQIQSNFGMRYIDGEYKFHSGIDINRTDGKQFGEPVRAAKGGTIIRVYSQFENNEKHWCDEYICYNTPGTCRGMLSYGNAVTIDHGDGTCSVYAHMCNNIPVTTGEWVNQGETIGYIGNSGSSEAAHLHFQIFLSGGSYSGSSYVRNTMPTQETIDVLGLWVVNDYMPASGYDSERRTYTNAVVDTTTPGKPAFDTLKSVYSESEAIELTWDETENTTHYNIYLDKENASGEYERTQTQHYAESGMELTLEPGNYRIVLQSTNSNVSGWPYTDGDWVYFTVIADTSYLDECVEYPCYAIVTLAQATELRTLPCTLSTDSRSKGVYEATKGETFTVTCLYENSEFEHWYETEYDGEICYLFGGHIKPNPKLQYSTTITGMSAPVELDEGDDFELEGVIKTEYSELKEVRVQIVSTVPEFDGSYEILESAKYQLSDGRHSYNLKNSSIDNAIDFGGLNPGTYKLDIMAKERHCTYSPDGFTEDPAGNYFKTIAETTFTVTAVPVSVTGVTMSPVFLELKTGETFELTATVRPDDADNKAVSWTSSNTAVATVSNGVVKAVSAGKAVITVTTEDGGYTSTCTVTVKNPAVPVVGVSLSESVLELETGKGAILGWRIEPTNADNQAVSWTSSNTAVATVSGGIVTAVGAGTAIITVITEDGGYTATCTVTVKEGVTTPAEKYEINSITVRDYGGAVLSKIPSGSYLATVSITNLVSEGDALVFLAAYTSEGQYRGMMWVGVEDVPVGATIKVTLPMDNSDGMIENLKAFAVESFEALTPLGSVVSFKP